VERESYQLLEQHYTWCHASNTTVLLAFSLYACTPYIHTYRHTYNHTYNYSYLLAYVHATFSWSVWSAIFDSNSLV